MGLRGVGVLLVVPFLVEIVVYFAPPSAVVGFPIALAHGFTCK